MDGLSCSTSQKSLETSRTATTYSQSHASQNKMENLGMGMGLRMGSGTSSCLLLAPIQLHPSAELTLLCLIRESVQQHSHAGSPDIKVRVQL